MARRTVFYQPEDGWVGDVIPFYDEGRFWLYYLHDRRDAVDQPAATSWHVLCTENLVELEDLGEVLPRGAQADPDRHAYTGSVLKVGGQYHLFYTGYNPSITDTSARPLQATMHAVSADLVSWKKLADDTFYAPDGQYDPTCWRDPFVFPDPRSGEFGMLLAAQLPSGSPRRRGCVAWCSSTDLRHWVPRDPFWSPGIYLTHECPDLFRIGDWWYLVFSEFSERFATRYRMSRDLDGPWIAPTEDTLDGRACYAAKTAADGNSRYAFGWLATKAGERDDGAWEWGGQLTIHELAQQPDGTLAIRLPEAIRTSHTTSHRPVRLTNANGWSRRTDGDYVGSSRDGLTTLAFGELPASCLVTGSIRFEPGTHSCGVVLRTGPELDSAYIVRLEPGRNRLVFDRWPRPTHGSLEWQIGGEVTHAVELERFIELDAESHHPFEILIDGTACTTYLDGRVAMSARMYDRRSGRWGLFVQAGAAEFTDLWVRTHDSTEQEGQS